MSSLLKWVSTDIVGEVASYLNQSEYAHFSQTCKSLHNEIIEFRNTLQQISIKPKMNYREIDFASMLNLKQICYNKYILPYNLKQPQIAISNLLMTNINCEDSENIKNISMVFIESIINKIHRNQSYSELQRNTKINRIIDNMLYELTNALHITSNHELVSYQNNTFPDELKVYTERVPKLEQFIKILTGLIHLFPVLMIRKLTMPSNWSVYCEIISALEKDAVIFQCAKNSDKLALLQILHNLLNIHHICPSKLFSNELINTLTTQFIVSTRSEIVSPHMEQIVVITYKLLTYFATYSINNNQQHTEITDHSNEGEIDGLAFSTAFYRFEKEREHWLNRQIINRQWFLWSISELVVPYNVYQNEHAYEAIIGFTKIIIQSKWMKHGRIQIIDTICKKWRELQSVQNINNYPRDSVFKILMIVLRNKEDHQFFAQKSGLKLIQKWIEMFILTDSMKLNQEEAISAISAALDFFIFHIESTMKYYTLITQELLAMIDEYIHVICTLFMEHTVIHSNNNNTQQMLTKSTILLQTIFDLDMKFFGSNRFIISRFLKRMATQLLPFQQSQIKYNLSQQSTLAERRIIRHLEEINESALYTQINDGEEIKKRHLIQRRFVENEREIYCHRISRLFEIFLSTYINTEKLYWMDSKFGKNTKSNLTDIMIISWWLQTMGCTFSETVTKNIELYLDDICQRGLPLNTAICWVTYCILITGESFKNQIFENEINMNILLNITKSVLESVSSEQFIEALILSEVIHKAKKNTFMKYLPLRLEMCMDSIIDANQDGMVDTQCIDQYVGFIRFYFYGLCYEDVMNVCIDKQNVNWWGNLSTKIAKVIQILYDNKEDKEEEERKELIECLNKISSVIISATKSEHDNNLIHSKNQCHVQDDIDCQLL